ncbi:hypothetical protein JXJ21_24760 [candidate division KSB1 bacterium]|nr:hypothetical protein [candidate division KSB1 bacterium]
MNTRRLVKSWYIVLLVGILGCSERNDQLQAPGVEQVIPPTFEFINKISIPQKMIQSQDSMVQRIVSHIDSLNLFELYAIYLTPPDSAEMKFVSEPGGNPEWMSNWVIDSLRIELDLLSGYFYRDQWEITVYDIAKNQNVMQISAFQTSDTRGLFNQLHVTNYPLYTSSLIWLWRVESGESLMLELSRGSGSIEFTPDVDGSSELIVWANSWVRAFRATWRSDGSGQWWTYQRNGHVDQTNVWSP